MRKLITPIIHLAFLLPMTFVSMGAIEVIARSFDLRPDYITVFRMPYLFMILAVITVSGVPVFWLANRAMRAIEKLNNFKTHDHFRQSSFYYFIIAAVLSTWIFAGFRGNEDDVYFLTWLSISMVSIAINIISIFHIREANPM